MRKPQEGTFRAAKRCSYPVTTATCPRPCRASLFPSPRTPPAGFSRQDSPCRRSITTQWLCFDVSSCIRPNLRPDGDVRHRYAPAQSRAAARLAVLPLNSPLVHGRVAAMIMTRSSALRCITRCTIDQRLAAADRLSPLSDGAHLQRHLEQAKIIVNSQ